MTHDQPPESGVPPAGAGARAWPLRRPRTVIGIGLLVVTALAPGMLHLELRTDGAALVPPAAPEILEDRAVRARFEFGDPVAVIVARPGGGIFHGPTLAHVRELTAALVELAGPGHVVSLATEKSVRVQPGTLEHRGLLDPLPEDPAALARLRREIRAAQVYTGTLVSEEDEAGDQGDRDQGAAESWNPTATAILVDVPATDRRDFLRAIEERLAGLPAPDGHEHHLVGAPVVEVRLGEHLLADLAILVPIAVVMMAGVFLLVFRTLAAVLLALVEVGGCLAFVFGLMGLLDVPLYLTVAVLPVILTAIGVADEIHIFHGFRRARARGAPVAGAVAATLAELRRPVVLTSVTSAAGFLSFALSPLVPVQAFGLLAAIGILFCMVWSLTVIPAGLVLVGHRFPLPSSPPAPARASGIGARAADLATALPRATGRARRGWLPRLALLTGALGFAGLAGVGIARLHVQDSWVHAFATDSEIARSTRLANEWFHGTHLLQVAVDTGPGFVAGRGTARAGDGPDATRRGLPGEVLLTPTGKEPRTTAREAGHQAGREAGHPANPPLAGRRLVIEARPAELAGTPPPATARTPLLRLDVLVCAGTVAEGSDPEGRLRVLLDDDPVHASSTQLFREFAVASVPARLLDPRLLEAVAGLESFLAGLGRREDLQVGGVLGPATQLAALRCLEYGYSEEARRLGRTARENRQLLGKYADVRGPRRRAQLVTPDGAEALVTVFLEEADYLSTARLLDEIEGFAAERLAPLGIRLRFAGDVAVSQAMIRGIVVTQLRSLSFSLLAVLVVSALLLRSVRRGFCCVLPATLAVLANGALLGWLGIPLGVATSMFAAMTLGIGVDHAIHLLERIRHHQTRGTWQPIATGTAETARPILTDVAVLALGFGVLIFSQVPANAHLGILVISSLLACALITLGLLPILVRGRRRAA